MKIEEKICPRCGKYKKVITSNNPLLENCICFDCANQTIDPNNLEHFAFFCRTFNIPNLVNVYLGFLKQSPSTALEKYIQYLYDKEQINYSDSTTDKWKDVQAEWEKVNTHRRLLQHIDEIKKDFIERATEKWGSEYDFNQLMNLETQFTTIVKSLNMTNPTQIENVKKYCKVSQLLDTYIAGGETKAILDATNALAKIRDLAGIQELSEVATEGTIKTVADLYAYMEKKGFQFDFYDQVDRDIVDSTIKDIQGSIRTQINNAVGLDVTFENIKRNYLRSNEELMEHEAEETTKLSDIVNLDSYAQEDEALDNQFDKEDVIFEDEDE